MSVTHIAGQCIVIGQFQRQRCSWCGEVLGEFNLRRVAVLEGDDRGPGAWPEGALVTVDGPASWVIEGGELPGDACALNPLTVSDLNEGPQT